MENQQQKRKQKKRGSKEAAAAAAAAAARAALAHHPWDEVSLPGAGTTEQTTILQVFNTVNADGDEQTKLNTVTANIVPTKEELSEDYSSLQTAVNSHVISAGSTDVTDHAQVLTEGTENALEARTPIESDNLVSSNRKQFSNSEPISISNLSNQTAAEPLSPSSEDQQLPNVLDIESHLIETYDDYRAKEDSVGINELPPINHELTKGSSKIETESNVRTIIEVEPAGPKIIKPVRTQQQGPQNIDDVTNTTSTVSEKKRLEEAKDNSADIKNTADKLILEIEQLTLKTLSEENGKAESSTQVEVDTNASTLTLEETRTEEITSPSVIISDNGEVKKTETSPSPEDIAAKLSQKVDEQLLEVTTILKANHPATVSTNGVVNGDTTDVVTEDTSHPTTKLQEEKIKIVDQNGLPASSNASEEEERKLFIDSLPHIHEDSDASKLVADCKREYYQSLRKYLIDHNPDKPPIPLQTYRWEDLRRAKERGGYPWTHLYKRPLGDDEEPELVLLLRKSQELRFGSESPKSLKKVHYDEQVLVKETERYIQELTQEEEHPTSDSVETTTEPEESPSVRSESISCLSDSVLAARKPRKSKKLSKIREFLRRRKSGRSAEDAQSLPGTSVNSSCHHSEENINQQPDPHSHLNGLQEERQLEKPHCFPIMKKLKSMADRQKKRLQIKRIPLKKDEKIVLAEETKIIKLKASPKSDRNEIPRFIEKQDSDDVLEIVELDESPSRKHKDDGRNDEDKQPTTSASVVRPDEIIEITKELNAESENDPQTPEPTVSEILEEEIKNVVGEAKPPTAADETPPRKTPRLRREHIYEEIDQDVRIDGSINEILDVGSVEGLKSSLVKQDDSVKKDIEATNKPIPLDRMGSSEEEQLSAVETTMNPTGLLAPISSIDSASSDEDRSRAQLSTVAEEDDVDAHNEQITTKTIEVNETTNTSAELKPSLKKEASPAPSDKKVTFSHAEDEEEPHREDIELSESVKEAAAKRWKNMR